MPFLLCADFSIFPDNTQLGPAFTLAAMDFQDSVGANTASFVNITLAERGLQFPDAGLEIDLPLPVNLVRMRVGQFANPYLIEGVQPSGNVVAALNTNFQNSYRNIRLRGPDIATIRFSGGQNEGVLVSVCIVV